MIAKKLDKLDGVYYMRQKYTFYRVVIGCNTFLIMSTDFNDYIIKNNNLDLFANVGLQSWLKSDKQTARVKIYNNLYYFKPRLLQSF